MLRSVCAFGVLMVCLVAAEDEGTIEREQLGFDIELESGLDLEETFYMHFDIVDSNKDGFLEYHELDARLHQVLLTQAENRKGDATKNAKEFMKHLDTDGDGRISEDEFTSDWVETQTMQLIHKLEEQAERGEAKMQAKEAEAAIKAKKETSLKSGQEMFVFADVDGDGRLDPDEYLVIFAPEFTERQEEVQLMASSQYISKFDLDHSKTLSKEELAAVDKDQANDWMSAWDTNNDGQLDKAEIQSGRFPVNEEYNLTPKQLVDGQITQMMRQLVTNPGEPDVAGPEGDERSWKISKAQAKKHADFFVAAASRPLIGHGPDGHVCTFRTYG